MLINLTPLRAVVYGTVAVIGLVILWGSWYTVDQTNRAVILRFGALAGTAEPGLGFKLPLVDSVVRISVQTQTSRWDKLPTYSRDQQAADLALSLTWRIAPSAAADVYAQFRSVEGVFDRLIAPRVAEESKTVFGRFNAVTAIQERGRLNAEVTDAISAAVKGPVIIESVQLENIDFSNAYEQSVEQRMLAEVEVLKLRQNAEREKVQAEITVTQAGAQADATRAKALADAEAIRIRGEAEAEAIKKRGDALAANPTLVNLVQAERWDGKLPTQMVPTSTLPILSLGPRP